ncbi:diguanylate cyclase (GGDEF) domain-containing protein [Neorhodopirellula lusitana]|uniref:diguanylate cyclase n=1 Tax=Neorhodopirellula lusitana TaxID=445327 RepID=A0ABY1PXM6_9BACT|nr:diguanylate cyclase [Neorhodopirellula lusitana]SMP51059.1 diguanylate cyclase (GGDEF) domain-containing protein [Neorhodopirellula lusitana]
MLSVNLFFLFAGLTLAVILLTIGYFFGRRGRKSDRREDSFLPPIADEDDRQRMVELLQSLARWTQEYSGNVSDYQANLQQISHDVRSKVKAVNQDAANALSRDSANVNDARMLSMIGEVMTANDQLQTRLLAAEKQLEEQTSQIESYLTEARTDGLTGLFNRRAFDAKLDEMFANYRGGGGSFVMILIDIDHFKVINDTHGHPVGDIVLQRIAAQLGKDVSDASIVARFGGEEFVILTELPIRIAAEKINAFRKRIADEPIVAGQISVEVTMSIGLSEPRDELVIGPIVRRADAALYCAKNRGRNRVYFDDGSGPQLFGAPEVVRT